MYVFVDIYIYIFACVKETLFSEAVDALMTIINFFEQKNNEYVVFIWSSALTF
jgi:hypothetical protein